MKRTNCYIYTRVSTLMQTEGYSLDAQKEALIRYATANDFRVAGEYCDAGRSGKSISGRPQFMQMLEDIKNKKDDISFVLVFKLSRFGRNAADVLTSLRTLQSNGANLICVNDGIDSSKDTGKLIITLLSAVAEIERENILEQTMEGRKQKAREGKWNGGFAPYGYKLVDGKLEVAEDEAEIIKLIYKQFITTNMGLNGVANWLNNQGYKKKLRQNHKYEGFKVSFIKCVIDNPVYCGKIAFGRRKTEKINGTEDKTRIVNSDEYILSQGIHEAIISEEDWNIAQAKRAETGHAYEKKYNLDRQHILTGLIKCPICGAGLTGNFSRKHSNDLYDRFYYHCKHGRFLSDGKKCNYKKNWPQEDVNAAVEKVICSLVNNPDFANAIKSQIGENLDITNLENEIKNLKAQLRKKESNKNSLISQIDNLDPDEVYYDKKYNDMDARLNNFYCEMEELEELISESEKRLENIRQQLINEETVYNYLIFFEKYYSQFTDGEKKVFMQALIQKIEIFEEKQENGLFLKSITFKFPMYFNSRYVTDLSLTDENTVEVVVQLSQRKPDAHIDIDLDLDELDVTAAEAKATYQEIKDYVFKKFGLNVSSLYIAQTKTKYGIIERENYYKGKEGHRVPNCPKEKEDAIVDALKYFKMI